MNWQKKKVLVTGADGFIGSHLVEELVRQGAEVRALALYNSFNSWGWLDTLPKHTLAKIEVVTGDVRDPYCVNKLVTDREIIFHLAALIAIPYSYHAPDSYVDTNIKGTLNVLQAAKASGARVVHTSTSEVYGTALSVPISEDHPLQGQSPYSATKIGADQLALSFHRSFSSPVTVARPFNTYGPRQSARAFIPTVITQIAQGAKSIRLGSLSPTRDFSFVEDTAKGFLAIASADKALGQVVNLGSGFEISMGDTAKLIAELMGKNISIENDSARVRPTQSEVERLLADTKRAKDWCGWTPEHGGREGFTKGLEKTIRWFSDPQNLARYKHDIYNI